MEDYNRETQAPSEAGRSRWGFGPPCSGASQTLPEQGKIIGKHNLRRLSLQSVKGILSVSVQKIQKLFIVSQEIAGFCQQGLGGGRL